MTTPPYRIAIVEDHRLQRARTEEILRDTGEFDVTFSGASLPEYVEWLLAAPAERRPHVLILDLMVDRAPSASSALVARLVASGLRIVVLSALTSPSLVRAVAQAGVAGIVGKQQSEDDILEAVRSVLRGEEWMTPELASVIAGDAERPELSIQEERALVLYASGLTVAQVGAAMNISAETAKQYLGRVRKKYAATGVSIRSSLDYGRVAWAEGYLSPAMPVAPRDGEEPGADAR